MSENLDLVRSIYADWERGDFGRSDWADREIEFVVVGGLKPGCWIGTSAMRDVVRGLLDVWDVAHLHAEELRELDGPRSLVLWRGSGKFKASGLDADNVKQGGAHIFHLAGEKVIRLECFLERDRAFADLGLEE
jgi:hypothetical protein